MSHYIWQAIVHGNNAFPIAFDALLDNGAHLVLIRPEAVIDLGLPIRKLKEPQCATLAINSMPQTFLLHDYVKLSLSSLNQMWTSCPVTALIANNLCVDILLGLPFLKHNKIVIDHELDTAIDKLYGFDLLHENAPSSLLKRQPKKLMPKQKRDCILYDRHELIKELKDTCEHR